MVQTEYAIKARILARNLAPLVKVSLVRFAMIPSVCSVSLLPNALAEEHAIPRLVSAAQVVKGMKIAQVLNVVTMAAKRGNHLLVIQVIVCRDYTQEGAYAAAIWSADSMTLFWQIGPSRPQTKGVVSGLVC